MFKTASYFTLLLLSLLSIVGLSFLVGTGLDFDLIPPIQVLYGSADAIWMVDARTAVHLVVGLAMGIISFLVIKSAAKTPRFKTLCTGSMLLVTSIWSLTVVGVNVFGGAWHYVGFVLGTIEAIAVLFVALLLLVSREK